VVVWKMSLPPEVISFVSDPTFLAAVGNLLYVLGGFLLGKWRSDKSERDLFYFLRPLALEILSKTPETFLKTLEETTHEPTDEFPEPMKKKLWEKAIRETWNHLGKCNNRIDSLKRSAKRSKWIGISCVAVGTALFWFAHKI